MTKYKALNDMFTACEVGATPLAIMEWCPFMPALNLAQETLFFKKKKNTEPRRDR